MNFYKWICSLNGLLFLCLFLVLMFSPESFLADLKFEQNSETVFILRRAAILMLGVSIVSTLARKASEARIQKSISLAFGIMLLGLAGTGIHAWGTRLVDSKIATSIIVESCLGLCFIYCLFKSRKETK